MFDDADERLAELVNQTNTYNPTRAVRQEHPRGFEPGVKYDSQGLAREVTTPAVPHLQGEEDWNKAVETMGFQIPEGYRLRLVEAKYDPAAWQRDHQGEDAVTRPVWRYRFAVESVTGSENTNLDELAKEIRRTRAKKPAVGGDGTLVVSWNDWQLFKSAGDGVEGTVARIYDSFDVTIDRVKALRKLGRRYPRLVVAATGDIVEGCTIYPHQAWEVQGDMRDQENAARRLIVQGLKAFAPHFEEIQVIAVGGNHGENRVDGKKINRHDNADAKVFEQAADVLVENTDAYGHVSFVIPREDLAATLAVESWVLGVTHGHMAGRGAGGPEGKLYNWFKGQAAGKRPVGDAHVLLSSHYHHARMADWGGCVWMQAPTMDGGSPFFQDLTGQDAAPGLLTFGMSEEHRVLDWDIAWL